MSRFSKAERETIVHQTAMDLFVEVESNQKRIVTRMRRLCTAWPEHTEVVFDSGDYIRARLPKRWFRTPIPPRGFQKSVAQE